MTCEDVRNLLPDLALGDLDAEPAAGAAAHLAACGACRADQGALARTVGTLKATKPLAPSTGRRSAAVAAMARVHAEQSERLLARRPRSWTPWATAAAFLLALAAALSVRGGGTAFTVARVSGRAELLDRESGVWRPLLSGEKVSVGDRLVTQPGCRVRLAGGAAEIVLDQDSSVDVVGLRRVTLDRGRLLAIAPASGGDVLVVTDTANNSVAVTGRVELSLREVTAHVGGSIEEKGGGVRLPAARVEVQRRLQARVQSGEAALSGAREQRLRASAGQEGSFTFGGQPATAPLSEPEVGAWAEGTQGVGR